ncbi:MAG TPA: response regulator, partial [Polyangiaceae bacterium]|nr:response regulator [Polyangiaceae bacterium]
GYEVVAVSSGEQAIEHVQREPARFSLVILDLAMPGMGGRKACDELHRFAPALKILVWSGYCSEGDADDLMAHGCSGFIQKPPSVSALSAKLHELLQSATF